MRSFRVRKPVWAGLAVDLAYGIWHGTSGLLTGSWWRITLSAYYIVLSSMRFGVMLVARRAKGDPVLERFAIRFTGIMLLPMSVCLAGAVVLTSVRDRGTVYHEIVMIAMALYAFAKVTLAIIRLVKARRGDSPAERALRGLLLCDALVSVFALQRSMLVSFPGMNAGGIRLMNILTGSGVSIFTFLSGIGFIGGRWIEMAKSKLVEANEKIAGAVVDGYKKVEEAVTGGYAKVEQTVVEAYGRLEDRFVEAYLTQEDETVAEAKERLKKKQG